MKQVNTFDDILGGQKLIAYMNEHSANTECIILTCHDEFDYAQTAVRLNCMEYVLKPVRYQKLTEILLRAKDKVNQRRQNEQIRQYGQQFIDSLAKETKGDAVNALEMAVGYIDSHLAEALSVQNTVLIHPGR